MTMRVAVAVMVALLGLAGCTGSGGDSAADPDRQAASGLPRDRSDHPLYAAWDRIRPADYQGLSWYPLLRYTKGKLTKTYLEFRTDGTWIGSDGCNVQSGQYRLWANGDLATSPDPQTAIGCLGVSISAVLDHSDRVDIDGRRLTLYDGTRVMLVLRTPPPAACCPHLPDSAL